MISSLEVVHSINTSQPSLTDVAPFGLFLLNVVNFLFFPFFKILWSKGECLVETFLFGSPFSSCLNYDAFSFLAFHLTLY